MVLHNSKFLTDFTEFRPVLYLTNVYEISSKELITSLIENGKA